MEAMLKNLKTAIFDVMEQMYFLLPDEDDGRSPALHNGYTVSIGISRNPRHRITLLFDETLAGAMSGDLLGLDMDEIDTEIIQKCLKETANVIAGNFLLGFNSEENRNVTLPYMKKDDVFGEVTSHDTQEVTVSFNDYGVTATLETVDPTT